MTYTYWVKFRRGAPQSIVVRDYIELKEKLDRLIQQYGMFDWIIAD